jgi:phytoene synthase
MTPELATSYRAAESIARSRARNFYYSFVVLPAEKRRGLCAVYAFMRYCDDISDGTSSVETKREMLRAWRARLDSCLSGDFSGSPILLAFHDTVRRFSVPTEYFHWIIDGAEMDLTIDGYETFQDLYKYCFNVASAVGLVCLQIFGYRQECAKKYAELCGVAFQLTNILRDVKEDAAMGRIYLPREDLKKFSYDPDDLQHGVIDDRFLRLMTFETSRTRDYYAQARHLLPLIEKTSRPALWAMMEIYEGILRKIIRKHYDVFGSSIRLSNPEKAAIALRALAMRFLPGGIGLR